jgi:ubiquinone/menaquinone biosynthesis C-methylase UbiE
VMLKRRQNTLRDLQSFKKQVAMYEQLVSKRNVAKPRILEVAAGTGFHSMELARHGIDVTALEIDPNLTSIMGGLAKHLDLNLTSVVGDACEIPLPDGRFDLVFSKNFFEHVYDVDLAIREQTRLLKPGGLLVIQDGNFLDPRLLFDLLFRYPLRTKFRHGGLVWLFTKRKVHKNLYGFLPLGRDEDVKTQFWWRRKISRFPGLTLRESTTTSRYTHPHLPRWITPFLGGCLLVAEKTAAS